MVKWWKYHNRRFSCNLSIDKETGSINLSSLLKSTEIGNKRQCLIILKILEKIQTF